MKWIDEAASNSVLATRTDWWAMLFDNGESRQIVGGIIAETYAKHGPRFEVRLRDDGAGASIVFEGEEIGETFALPGNAQSKCDRLNRLLRGDVP